MPRRARQLMIVARLAPDATLDDANTELAAVAARVERRHASELDEYRGWRLTATPWSETQTGEARPAGLLVLGAVGLLLLVACANLANLLIARAAGRQREIALRQALGAGRARLMCAVVAETMVLAAAGGAVGLLLAQALLAATVDLVPAQLEALGLSATISGRVLAWTAAIAVGSAFAVAILPGVHLTRGSAQAVLRAAAPGLTPARQPQRVRQALIVAEVALTVALLSGAAVLMRSVANLDRVAPGFEPANVLTMRVTVPQQKYRDEAVNQFIHRILDRVAQTTGVSAVSAATQLPEGTQLGTTFSVPGRADAGDARPSARYTIAAPAHFDTLRIPLRAGRHFTDADRLGTPLVAIVNETFAREFLDGAAVGRRVEVEGRLMTVVGMSADTRNRGAAQPPSPEIFIPMDQQTGWNQFSLMIRTTGDATAMLPAVRQAIAAIDPDQPVYFVRTLDEARAEATFQQRVSMIMLALFAAVAVTLAAVGIYGVTAFAVGARAREIGIRIAVGAERRAVIWLVLRQVCVLAVAGAALGVVVVAAARGALRRIVFDVQPFDPASVAAAAAALTLVALLAGSYPAWRASRVDPARTLRMD